MRLCKKRPRFVSALVMLVVFGTLLFQAAISFADNNPELSAAQLEDIQQIAKQKGITMEEAIARYGWQDSFSKAVGQIRMNFPDRFAGAAITDGGRGAWIAFKGEVPETAVELVPALPVEVRFIGGRGFSEADLKRTLERAYYAIAEDGDVASAGGGYDIETGVITIEVKLRETPGNAVEREWFRARLMVKVLLAGCAGCEVRIVDTLDGGLDGGVEAGGMRSGGYLAMVVGIALLVAAVSVGYRRRKTWGRVSVKVVAGVVLLVSPVAFFLGYRIMSDGKQSIRIIVTGDDPRYIVTGDDPRIVVERFERPLIYSTSTVELEYDPDGRCLFAVGQSGSRMTPVWSKGTKSIRENGKHGVAVPGFGKIFDGDIMRGGGGLAFPPLANLDLPDRCLTSHVFTLGDKEPSTDTGDAGRN